MAPDLLGCVLWHWAGDALPAASGPVAVELTEVEAYMGEADPPSHAYRGKTARTAVMFGPPGHAYVYFTYGMHFCVNLVCLPEGTASAVLLRAGRIVAGEDLAMARRGFPKPADLARGPARLCQALGIDRARNGADVCTPGLPLLVTSSADRYDKKICQGPRVGVSSGAEVPWRYWIDGDRTVSAYRAHVPRNRKPVTPSPR